LCLSAQSSGHLKVGEPANISAARGSSVEAKIPVTVDAGFHVNSNHPSEDYLIPLSLKWTSLGALEGGEVGYPPSKAEKYDFSEKPLSVFSGSFSLTARFKVAATAPPGPGVATGKLRYQACNSNTCFPPKTVDVNVTYQVQ
jgi:thiol:disulfide interchange protein DsbD